MDLPNRLPATGAGFVWDDFSLKVDAPVDAIYTTRVGGTSEGPFGSLNLSYSVGDEPDRVRANRSRVQGGDWRVVRQVHGCDVVRAGPERSDADAQWTDGGDTLAVFSADCVLLLLVGPQRIGVAHAGWRGLAAGVIENAIEATGATEVFAGPAIGPCCFEVGAEVTELFRERFADAVVDDRHVDLWAAAASAAAGTAFHAARICTSCHPELFFSHRRDKGRTGRQALISKKVR